MNLPILDLSSHLSSSQEIKIKSKSEFQIYKLNLRSINKLPIIDIGTPHASPQLQQFNINHLNNLSQSLKNSSQLSLHNANEYQCSDHNKNFCYICKTCNQKICVQCLTNPSKHRGHRFQRYTNTKQIKIKSFNQISDNFLSKIKNKINQIFNQRKNSQFHLSQLEYLKKCQFNQIQQYINSLKQHYNTENTLTLEQSYNQNKTTITNLTQFYQNCITKLKSTKKGDFILIPHCALQYKLTTKLTQLTQLSYPPFIQHNFNPIHQNLQIFTFYVKEFSSVRDIKGQILFQPFTSCYSLWRLKVYPGGFAGAKVQPKHKGVQYMSIYIQRLDGILNQSTYFVQFLLTSVTQPNLQIKKSFQSVFTKEQSWGYDRYTRLTNISQCGFLTKQDTLTIQLSICTSRYYQTSRAQNKLIQQKQKIVQQNIKKIQRLKNLLHNHKQPTQIPQPKQWQFLPDQSYVLQINEDVPLDPSQKTLQQTQPTQYQYQYLKTQQTIYPQLISSQTTTHQSPKILKYNKKLLPDYIQIQSSIQMPKRIKYKNKNKSKSKTHNRSITHI